MTKDEALLIVTLYDLVKDYQVYGNMELNTEPLIADMKETETEFKLLLREAIDMIYPANVGN